MNRLTVISFLVFFMISFFPEARPGGFQQDPTKPEIGKPIPEFILQPITQFTRSRASRDDFKGKWLFLDFWSLSCVTCIQSFPLINAHHKEFKDQLSWVMVGLVNSENPGAKELYEKLRSRQGLEMPFAYDSTLFAKWDISSMPHIIIVDPEGLVYSISNGSDITAEKIRGLLRGEKVAFRPKDLVRPDFDPAALTVAGEIANSSSVLYRSVLTKWNGERQYVSVDIPEWITWPKENLREGYKFAMVPLYALYNYAYVGKWQWDVGDTVHYSKVYPAPVLEIENPSLFDFDYNMELGKGTYNYNLVIPLSGISEERIMKLMQEDLKRAFGFEVSLVMRKVPVWSLVAKPGVVDKLKSKGGPKFFSPGSMAAGYTMKNVEWYQLLGGISFYVLEKYKEPFVDDTGVKGKIDFTLQADMTNLEDVRRALRKQGLDLVKGTREMKVIVIKDPGGL